MVWTEGIIPLRDYEGRKSLLLHSEELEIRITRKRLAVGMLCYFEIQIFSGMMCLTALLFFYWIVHYISPFSPWPVIIFHVLIAKQVFQNEPCVRRPFVYSTVCDSFLLRSNSFWVINLLQIFYWFKCPIGFRRLTPRYVWSDWNMSSSLSMLSRILWRSQYLSSELFSASYVNIAIFSLPNMIVFQVLS